jgi:hypothetical protein
MRFKKTLLTCGAGIALVIALVAFGNHAKADPYPIAVLRALDKVTARTTTLEAPVDESTFFGSLEIIAKTCDKAPPEELPESAAFLDIYETVDGDTIENVFRGWMFASSPGLSAMEHRVYDIWVIDCRRNSSKPVIETPSPAPR